MGRAGETGRLDRFDKGPINAAVEAELFLQMGRPVMGSRKGNLHVGRARQLGIGYTDKIPATEIFHGRHHPAGGDDDLLNAVNDLFNGLFLATIIDDKSRAVISNGGVHGDGGRRLSRFMATEGPCVSSNSKPVTYEICFCLMRMF